MMIPKEKVIALFKKKNHLMVFTIELVATDMTIGRSST